ncbi:MAG: metallophosphoesterase [Bacteroidales bacterium]|nr:metallophosphoesterase [Bacteroidales bacterium]
MKQKKLFYTILVVLLVVAGYFLTTITFPKNASRYPAIIILLLIDYYVWGLFKKKVFTYHKLIKSATVLLYWLPFLMLLGTTIATYYIGTKSWNPLLRNIIFGGIFSFYVAKVLMAIVLGIADLIKAGKRVVHLFKKDETFTEEEDTGKITRAKFMERIAFVTGGLVVTTMFAGMFRWVHDFDIKDLFIKIKDLPGAFEGYKVVQISDLHLGTWSNIEPLKEAIQLINDINPDLIVFTGDLVNYTTDEAIRFKEVLSGLQAKDGVFAILGNHDYGDYVNWPSKPEKQKNMEALYQFYNQINWKLLRNENVVISRGEDKLALIGVENWSANTRFPQYGNILKASKGLGKVPVKILLSHDPSHWNSVVLDQHKDINLMLAGHTHGFQFGIEIPGIKWSPAQYIYNEWAGLYKNEASNQMLYVNRGLGSIGYPGRIGILPEITIINLQS